MDENRARRSKFVESLKHAVDLEQRTDSSEMSAYLESYSAKRLSRLGLAVINLIIGQMRTGLGGKTLITLELDPALKNGETFNSIQMGSIRVGDIVKLERMDSTKSSEERDVIRKGGEKRTESDDLDCVVTKITSDSVTIAVEEDSSDEKVLNMYNNTSSENPRVWIVKLSNSITFKRMITALNKMKELPYDKTNDVIRMLLGELEYQPWKTECDSNLNQFFDCQLNESQKEAVNFAVHRSPISIIHGPPGTGKTYTVIETIKQLVFNNQERVLVCAPSNIAVDTILERLSPMFNNHASTEKKGKRLRSALKSVRNPDKLIRIGHPARLIQGNLKHSLDVLSKRGDGVANNNNQEILKDIERDISDTLVKIRKCKAYSERRALWAELKTLKKELKVRERRIVQELLVGANVILSTLHGSGSYELLSLYKENAVLGGKALFDTIIIDEVSQALEPQCWIPLVSHPGFKRLIIAGDNMQLPPTVKSKEDLASEISKLAIRNEEVANLEVTLFDRLVRDLEGNRFKKLLNVQYRMNDAIMNFPSNELYGGQLRADKSVANILITDLPNISDSDDLDIACLWFDTQGGDFPEKSDENNDSGLNVGSKYNEMEVHVILQHLKKLLDSGVSPQDIGLISPYSAQVSLLKRTLQKEDIEGVEVSTVDGFQGREKEAILISLVRSNDSRDVGFLKDKRRLNVAMTRPRRQLCVVGDLELMATSGIKFLMNWSSYAEQEFEIRYPILDNY
ncbi:uncharacterized protein PRCAT00001564001 [Priceomyces carsonii]|uniref:uncharacterized protein n=1 Tax=Priceomyces carsonii TaxID=28549 RepID=UPI002EDB9AB7|nr:unnamed protein product [Priceomyces carsonii]